MWDALAAGLTPLLSAGEALAARVGAKAKPRKAAPPQARKPPPDTPPAEVDALLAQLRSGSEEWTRTACPTRAALLDCCLHATLAVSDELAAASGAPKGSYEGGLAEEFSQVVAVMLGMRDLRTAMRAGGAPPLKSVTRRADGTVVATVFPQGTSALLFSGFAGEVWLQPGKDASQGALYRSKAQGQASTPGVCLVLAAGNTFTTLFADILYQLFTCDHVVVVKMNPVNAQLGPLVARALAPLVEARALAFAYGGAALGSALCASALVDFIHITGSAATYDNIVWGPDVDKNASGASPVCRKPVSAELGNVTAVVVVPGAWSADDMADKAEDLVTHMANNAGHNCVALEVIVTPRGWPLRDELLAALRRALQATSRRVVYYPGSLAKHEQFLSRFPNAEKLGVGEGWEELGERPWVLAAGLTPEQAQTRTENWCGVVQEVALPFDGSDIPGYLQAAGTFLNEQCWGSLSAGVFVPPDTARAHAEEVEALIASLRYGTVAVNLPPLICPGFFTLAWGAYPGNDPRDVGSGIGFVNNTTLLDWPQKSVLRGPWRAVPKPFWRTTFTNAEAVSKVVMRYAASGSLLTELMFVSLAALEAVRG